MNENQIDHKKITSEYIKEIRKIHNGDNYTEMTFRTPFQNFIESMNSEYSLLQEPERKRNLGAPDFKAHRKSLKTGYIETKNLEVDLDKEIKSEQLTKYKDSIDNIIFTNYHRFILIRNGSIVLEANLFNMTDLNNTKFSLGEQEIQKIFSLVENFFEFNKTTISSVEELAHELSKKTKMLRDVAAEQLHQDLESKSDVRSTIYDFYQGIKELIHDISIEDCADAYAQTITYGLFLAKLKLKKGHLDRDTASLKIPQSIMIIRKIFTNITGELISDISWIIDEIIDVLNACDVEAIISEMDIRGSNDKDPFSFFYEDFLSKYEPEKRKHMGVYYTPRPIVTFIVTSVNQILKQEFGKVKGFVEDDVTVLDPATGTATFLWLVYHQSMLEIKSKGLAGMLKQKIQNHILKNFFGFEIQITPYIFAHLKLSSALDKFGYELTDKDRSQIYLTNTLEPAESHGLIPFMRELNEESNVANQIKNDKKILAIIGNPPYSSISANNSTWIEDLLKKGYKRADGTIDSGYYQVDGQPLGERNPKWLQDDYVKFIRFAQWKIDTAGEGVVGYVTNHSYLDNATFMGMRKSLMDSFDTIYLLNLHGNIIKKETAPNGNVDENVFENIKQGVVISIFVKSGKSSGEKKVFYADLWGKRLGKFQWLDRHVAVNSKSSNIISSDVEWQELHPKPPYYHFVPTDLSLQEEYDKFWKITDIFQIHSTPIMTARDDLAIKWSPDEMLKTVTKFASLDPETARMEFNLKKDGTDWKIEKAQKDLIKSGISKEKIIPIHYRPFDIRYTYYTGKSGGFHGRPRYEVMQHMLKQNIGLITRRQMLPPFNYVFVSEFAIAHGLITSDNKGVESIFPLYRYTQVGNEKIPNINEKLFGFLKALYYKEISSETIFYYIYSILYSPKYRKKYEGFLKFDFPRIPFIKDHGVFETLSKIGKELVLLHTMKTKCDTQTSFNIQGTNKVDYIKYDNGKIKINETQFFEGVTEVLWNFSIGAYKVLEKWLKSRKGRELSSSEIEHFLQIIEIVRNTIEYTNKIDKITTSINFD